MELGTLEPPPSSVQDRFCRLIFGKTGDRTAVIVLELGIAEAAHHGDERTTLLGVLQRQRDLVAWKLEDAPDHVLTSVATPSGMGLHGLVRHLTNVERSWLRDVFVGQHDLR